VLISLVLAAELQAVGQFTGPQASPTQVVIVEGSGAQELLVRFFFWGRSGCAAYFSKSKQLLLDYKPFTVEVDSVYHNQGFTCEPGKHLAMVGSWSKVRFKATWASYCRAADTGASPKRVSRGPSSEEKHALLDLNAMVLKTCRRHPVQSPITHISVSDGVEAFLDTIPSV
jgi:hypothetical protein